MKKLLLLLIATMTACCGANYYIDNARPGGGDGRSWASAWNSVGAVSNLKPGDVCYISGGSTSKTYNIGNGIALPSGTSGNPVTLSASNDAGHTGMVVFQGDNSTNSTTFWPANWVTINGRVGGTNRFRAQGSWTLWAGAVTQQMITGVRLLGINARPHINVWDSRQTEIGWIVFDLANAPRETGLIRCVGRTDNTNAFGANSIHDCYMPLYYNVTSNPDGAGSAQDAIKDCSRVDIYNNTIIGFATTNPTSGDHQDGIQMSPHYTRIFNNSFTNMANAMIFLQMGSSSINSVHIYNNVFNYSDPNLKTLPAVDIGAGGTFTYNDVLVANNTFHRAGQSIKLGYEQQTSVFNNTRVSNNLYYNSGAKQLRQGFSQAGDQ